MVAAIAMFAACDPDSEGPSGPSNGDGDGDGPVDYGYAINWDKTTLKIKYTNDDQSGELSSGCERYYAGESANFEDIDDLVRQRNAYAATAANVTVEYDYFTSTQGWGQSTGTMVTEATSDSSEAPDIYYNFVYDISGAQLNGCFANLKGSYANGNNFRFNDSDYNWESDNYFDSTVGEGYFYAYMQSLSLNNNKLYALASDFCVDLVRSFLVVPVNIEMLESIEAKDTWTGDMTNGFYDFYDLVWRTETKVAENEKYGEGWTYDVLAHYAAAINNPTNDNGSDHVLADTVGFAAGKTSGLVSSGFLYTVQSVDVIEENVQADGTKNPTYPETNANLNTLVSKMSELFTKTGIVAVGSGSFDEIGEADAGTELQAIRNRFAKSRVLFGGIIALGSLEETVYQNMLADGGAGFGILPVPLYNSADDYLTLVHNLAKVVAISKSTTEFSQASAYLDYLSRQSADVIDEYYNVNLVSKTGGVAAEQNKTMLAYIRNHVKDAFAKTIEDEIGLWKGAIDKEVTANKFHEIIASNGFGMSDFTSKYGSLRGKKQEYLAEAVAEWNKH